MDVSAETKGPEKVLKLIKKLRTEPDEKRLDTVQELKDIINADGGNFVLSYNDNGDRRYMTLNDFTLNNARSHFLNRDERKTDRAGEYLDEFFVNDVADLQVAYRFSRKKEVVRPAGFGRQQGHVAGGKGKSRVPEPDSDEEPEIEPLKIPYNPQTQGKVGQFTFGQLRQSRVEGQKAKRAITKSNLPDSDED